MDGLVGELVEGGVIKGETVAMDATFIEAYSRRDIQDNRRGYSDPDARVGRDDRSYGLGYRAHIATDTDSDLPVACVARAQMQISNTHARVFIRLLFLLFPRILILTYYTIH